MASPESSRTWIPTYSALEETVQGRRYDRWSFGLALLAASISIFFLGEPIACVSPEEATIPMQCKALEDYQKQRANVRLRAFCYGNCSDASSNIYTYAMIFGLLLHTIESLPDVCGCSGFMRITCSCNYSSGSQSWNDSRFKSCSKWVTDTLDQIRRMNSRRIAVQKSMLHQIAVTLYGLALVEFFLHTVSSLHLHHHGVSFTCTGLSGQHINLFSSVTTRLFPSFGRAAVLSLLVLSALLGQKARFGFSFRCTIEDLEEAMPEEAMPGTRRGQVCLGISGALKHDFFSQVIGNQLTSEKNVENQEQQPAPGHDATQRGSGDVRTAPGLLSRLRSSFFAYLPRSFFAYFPRSFFAYFPEPHQQQMPSRLVDVTFEQPAPSEEESRRGWILIVAAFAMILLHSASTSCWASINQIHLEDSEGDLFAIQAKLLLLGSSGRRKGSGVLCWLGALCMLLVAFAQWLVMAAKRKPDLSASQTQTPEEDPSEEMRLTYMIRGEISMEQERQSHVWLQPPQTEGDPWVPADFSVHGDARSKWRRSQDLEPLVKVTSRVAGVNSKGLPTDQHGESDTYIQFEKDGRTVTQVVPLDFLDDTAYVSLNVGSQMAWDNFAIAASIVASLLTLTDLMFHLIYQAQGQLLLNCGDIFSEGCLMLDNELDNEVSAQVPASSAIGVLFALLGAVVASSTVIMLVRVRTPRISSSAGQA